LVGTFRFAAAAFGFRACVSNDLRRDMLYSSSLGACSRS
jgi:hypothetical protein